jgi:oligosaccharide reducing-end xylanase
LFVESGKHTIEDVQTKLDSVFNQLFYGNDVDERLFYWADGGTSEAYIWSVDSNDVRSEGMSYGMMIAVQLDRRTEFDGLWRWAKKNMQHNDGSARDGYFAWKCRTDGSKMDHNTASDGEEWFVTALFFAADRWGSNSEFDYAAEANRILYASTHKSNTQSVTNLFSAEEKMVVFTPYGHSATFTDASYHLPTFYRVWAKLANESNAFYASMADESRVYFQKSAHPSTGLMSDYSEFDGTLTSGGQNFAYDAWRAGTNVATDYAWFGDNAGTWAKTHADTLLRFFYGQGVDSYVDQFKLDGTPAGYDHSAGLVAMNAVVALAATDDIAWEFVEAFWNLPVPTGKFRYYNGMLYMWGFLHVSGNFKAWVNTSAAD